MRRIKVKRQALSTGDTVLSGLIAARKRICELDAACDRREESLRVASNLIMDLKEEVRVLKEQRQEYRNEGIEQRVLKERAEKARNTVTQCYDALLWQVAEISEQWYDRHLNETGNILGKEPFDPNWEDDLEAKTA